uniref:Uncharacterized protein n=1 Tax=Cannabis sativa TaxID=3483 RepID=A0A803P1A9_CANSA
MNTTLSLSEKERDVHILSATDLQDSDTPPKFFLVARCLSSSVNPQTFIKKMGEFWSNKCRFEVVVSEMHSDLFLLTTACAGDKCRVLSGEPWHFFNQLILFHSPASLQSVKKEDLFKAQFWIQTHRLPFLNVTQPLMRGKMVTLPKVQDEHWPEFRYENLPTFCFHCGILGHPFDKCKAFLELVDSGVDPDLPYGPHMIGDKLPKVGYDRYCNDFSKVNAYPFLTRLAKKSIASTLPELYTNPNIAIGAMPQPKPLTIVESNTPDQSATPKNNQSSEMPLPFPSYIPTAFHSASSSANHIPNPLPPTQVHLPQNNSLNIDTITSYPSLPISSKPYDNNPVSKNKGKAIMMGDESTDLGDIGKSFKRQIDPENLQSVLKRCRDRVHHSLKFSNGLGLKGGLLLLWITNIDVTLNSYSMNYFDAFVLYENGCRFHFTAFYGAPKSHLRINTWNLLRSFATPSNNISWLVLGDFNELLSNEDKYGGPLKSDKLMNDFRQAIDFCNLIAIPYTRDRFTWTNKHYTGTLVKERLDRGFHNGVWTDFFVDATLSHLNFYHSDHRAIAYNVSLPQQLSISTKRHQRFRFEQFWLKDSDCRDIIQASWKSCNDIHPIPSLLQNIADCSSALQDWHVSKYGQMGRDIAAAQKHSSHLHNSNDRSIQHFKNVEDADKILDDLLEKEELYWHQRARVDWLQSGDSNTQFFHARAKSRNATNKIKTLNTVAGGVVHGDEEIANEVTSYFSQLFNSNATDVENALHSMAPDKSPGVDDMSAMFFQKHWDIVGLLVTQSVLQILNEGANMTCINSALITLIPKIDLPKFVSEFRPISLCTVIYKLVSKAIAVRFKEALPFVISQHQSAFLPNRLITDNVLLVFELIHCLKNKNLPKKFCNQLEAMMANFWWGSHANHSKIHWKKWKFLCSSKVDGGMGFRSFLHFNQALLAKQAWRIFDDPSSLLARVLQARYFKDGNFLSAKKGVLPSLTWQSIYDGKELLLKGLRRKIGNGQSVRCATNPWLLGNTTFTPYHYGGDPLFTVAHYITNDRQWDLRIQEDHFGNIDIERILSILLAPTPREDTLIWHHSDTGNYTVKSGYHLAASLESMEADSPSSSNHQWWNRFWSLKLPKKVKIFAWRFINDDLPTAANLMHRKISTSSACSLCLGNLKGYDIFSYLATVNKDADLERIICIMWCIWSERNKEIHGSKPKIAEVICSYSYSYLAQYRKATAVAIPSQTTAAINCNNQSTSSSFKQTISKWKPPGKDMYKLNIDATIDSNGAIIGVGALIRTDEGVVVAGLSKALKGYCSPKEMEALAMFYSLQWALMHQFPLHFIEFDSLLLINALNCLSSTKCITPFHDLVEDINYLMSFFPRVKVSHVKRDANQAAHDLAKFALRLDEDMFWLGEIPSPIVSLVVTDSSH